MINYSINYDLAKWVLLKYNSYDANERKIPKLDKLKVQSLNYKINEKHKEKITE